MGAKQKKSLFNCRIRHAIRRLMERHGIRISEHEFYYLILQIIEGHSKFVFRFTNNYTLHKVLVRNQWIPVLYSKRHKLIITVYCNGWIKTKSDGSIHVNRFKIKEVKRKRDRSNEKPHWQLKSKWSRAKRDNLGIS